MTNFDIFLSEPKFASFAEVAVSAERILQIDPAACVLMCRRAMEFAVKWMYSADEALELPWDDKLVSLMSTDEFRDVVGADMLQRLHYIRKVGNTAAHAGKKITTITRLADIGDYRNTIRTLLGNPPLVLR